MQKIKISSVSYINSLPFIYGIENSNFLNGNHILYKDSPAACADKLISNTIDLGLIPVAEILKIKNPQIISDYCIGAVGKVRTVLLFSQVPLHEINTILLDYESRTSVNLVKILAKEFWKIKPVFINAEIGFEKNIKNTTAGVVIGDRTFDIINNYKYVYDLSEEWTKLTNLPFVFAAWVANKPLPSSFIQNFNNSCKFGINNIKKVIEKINLEKNNYSIKQYLTKDIS